MAAVAPVGDEITDGAELPAGLRRRAKIGQRVVVPADERLPGRGSGTDVKGNRRLRELRRFLFKRVICLVAPVQGNNVYGRDALLRVLADRQVGPDRVWPIPESASDISK